MQGSVRPQEERSRTLEKETEKERDNEKVVVTKSQ